MAICGNTLAGWYCTRKPGHDGPCAARSIDESYFVEVDQNGCSHCGAGRSWIVVDPDGVGGGKTYLDYDDAQEVADMMNESFQRGVSCSISEIK